MTIPTTAETTPDSDGTARFAADTSKHQMTILRNDGLYRHLRFRAPDSGFYWFDLITWPGYLAFVGDMDGYVFARTDDMFDFFRRSKQINPVYWSEKIVDGRERAKRYSEDKARRYIEDHIASYGDEVPGLREEVQRRILGDDPTWDLAYEEGAREALRDFEFLPETGVRARHVAMAEAEVDRLRRDSTATGYQVTAARQAFEKAKQDATFQFVDTWEWDLADWDWTFLWCCHAIRWGIEQYDAARAS